MLHAPVNEAKSQDGHTKRPQMPLPERERYPLSVETPGHPSLTGNGNDSILPSVAARSRSPIGGLQRLYGNQAVLQMGNGSGGSPAPSMPLRPSQSRSGILQRKCACGGAAGMSGECEECGNKKKLGLQTKLKVNEPGDIYEREADRVADQVMATPTHPAVSIAPPRIQRFSGQSNGQMDAVPSSVDQALATSGKPLEPALRQDMEQRFGHDFSRVRVHSGVAAEQSAHDVNAKAYTMGQDIVFGAGRFSPGTHEGQRLLAHELTHVIQQGEKTDNIKSIRRQPEVCKDFPEVCLDGTPEIVAMPPPGGDITVGREGYVPLSAVQFEVKLNPKGDNPIDYRWSVELEDPNDTVQARGITKGSPFEASLLLKGLKPGQSKIFPMLEIRKRKQKPVQVKGEPVTVAVVPVDVLEEAAAEYRKYLADYESYTRKWTELKLKESKGEKVDDKVQEANAEEIKRYERARQKAEEAAKVALDVSKKKKVHDEIGSLLENIDLAIERIETAKADGHHEAIMLLNAEELEKSANAQAFWIALAGNLLWALSGSLPWAAAAALSKMKFPKMKAFFTDTTNAATHTATAIGTVGAMMAQFSSGLPSAGQRTAGLKKELLKYFGIINAQVANKQRRMSRLLLLYAMNKEPPTEKMDPIDYVAELSVGLRYNLYGDIYKEGLNDGALPDGAKIKDFARDQLLHQYVAGSSAISGGKIAPTAITELEGENLVEQAIKALGGQKVLLFEPYELVKNQLLRAASDIGVSIYEPYIDILITELMSGRDHYIPITAPNKDKLVNLMDAFIVCINDGGVSGECSFVPLSKEEAKPVVDSIISEGIDGIWVVNRVLNTITREGRTIYSVRRFFLLPKNSTPTDKYQHLIYKVST